MKKEDIEKGMSLFTNFLKNQRIKLDYAEDVCYMRKIDGIFQDSTGQKLYVLGHILLTEDPEKLELLDKMVIKTAQKQNYKLEDLGELP